MLYLVCYTMFAVLIKTNLYVILQMLVCHAIFAVLIKKNVYVILGLLDYVRSTHKYQLACFTWIVMLRLQYP